MLPNPILVSDEEKQIFDRVWNSYVEKILRVSEVFMPHGNKIIAGIEGLPKLDLSAIAEEIGWVDVEKLAYKRLPIIPTFDKGEIINSDTNFFIRLGWVEGFKAAQSLNEKKFSEEDMSNLWQYIVDGAKEILISGTTSVSSFEDYIQSLSKPKEYNVEAIQEGNTIKVTKILN